MVTTSNMNHVVLAVTIGRVGGRVSVLDCGLAGRQFESASHLTTDHFDFPYDWVTKGPGISSCVCDSA